MRTSYIQNIPKIYQNTLKLLSSFTKITFKFHQNYFQIPPKGSFYRITPAAKVDFCLQEQRPHIRFFSGTFHSVEGGTFVSDTIKLGRADELDTVCSDTCDTDCRANMVPITVIHLVPIQRYQQENLRTQSP